MNLLVKQKLIEVESGYGLFTLEGWDALARAAPGGAPRTRFVAMTFDPSMDEAYELGIRVAVRTCGPSEIRVDKIEHNDLINDVMLSSIRRTQVTVADVTLHRQGVYFEAGFALGLGRIVIWTCREDEIDKVHFDTRQYPHVVWKTPHDLAKKLENRIRATVQLPVR